MPWPFFSRTFLTAMFDFVVSFIVVWRACSFASSSLAPARFALLVSIWTAKDESSFNDLFKSRVDCLNFSLFDFKSWISFLCSFSTSSTFLSWSSIVFIWCSVKSFCLIRLCCCSLNVCISFWNSSAFLSMFSIVFSTSTNSWSLFLSRNMLILSVSSCFCFFASLNPHF